MRLPRPCGSTGSLRSRETPAAPARPRRRLAPLLTVALSALALGPAVLRAQPAALGPAAHGEDAFVPVTDAMLQDPAPGDWLMWRRTLDGWGFRNVHFVKC